MKTRGHYPHQPETRGPAGATIGGPFDSISPLVLLKWQGGFVSDYDFKKKGIVVVNRGSPETLVHG